MNFVEKAFDKVYTTISKPAMFVADKLESHDKMKREHFQAICGVVTIVAGVILFVGGLVAQGVAVAVCPPLSAIIFVAGTVSCVAFIASFVVRHLPMSDKKRLISSGVCKVVGYGALLGTMFPVPGLAVFDLGVHILRTKAEDFTLQQPKARDNVDLDTVLAVVDDV